MIMIKAIPDYLWEYYKVIRGLLRGILRVQTMAHMEFVWVQYGDKALAKKVSCTWSEPIQSNPIVPP